MSDNVMMQPSLLDIPVNSAGRPLNIKDSLPLDSIKMLVEHGVPYDTIVARYANQGLTYQTLAKWASRYNWITPFKLENAIAIAKSQAVENERVNLNENLKNGTSENVAVLPPVSKLSSEDETIEILAQEALRTGKRTLAGLAHRIAPALNAYTPETPETVGEASILLKMLTKAAGLDSAQQQTNVQVNVVSGPWGRNIEHSFMEASEEE